MAPVRIETSRPHHGRWIVGLEGVTSMDDAETLRDLELRVAADTLHPLAPGAHYVHDLQACLVRDDGGAEIGRVARVEFGRGHAVLVVTGERGDEVMVPLAEEICRRDRSGGEADRDRPAGRA